MQINYTVYSSLYKNVTVNRNNIQILTVCMEACNSGSRPHLKVNGKIVNEIVMRAHCIPQISIESSFYSLITSFNFKNSILNCSLLNIAGSGIGIDGIAKNFSLPSLIIEIRFALIETVLYVL